MLSGSVRGKNPVVNLDAAQRLTDANHKQLNNRRVIKHKDGALILLPLS